MINRATSLVIFSILCLSGCGDKDDTATDTSATESQSDTGASDTAGEAL